MTVPEFMGGMKSKNNPLVLALVKASWLAPLRSSALTSSLRERGNNGCRTDGKGYNGRFFYAYLALQARWM
jgi:hypothetical protein